MRFGDRHAVPQRTLHIVLKKKAGYRQFLGKVQRRGQEIADCNVESPARKLARNQLANRRMRELGDRIWRESRQPVNIVHDPKKALGICRSGVHDLRLGKLLVKGRLVIGIASTAAVRQQGHTIIFRESPQNVVRADLTARIDGEEFPCLDPQHSQSRFLRLMDSN